MCLQEVTSLLHLFKVAKIYLLRRASVYGGALVCLGLGIMIHKQDESSNNTLY